jgi:dihydropteroate synthase
LPVLDVTAAQAPMLSFRGGALRLDRPRVVGILNVTPDSFSDGGQHAAFDAAVEHGLRMVEEGADMLDIGGESTRPGSAGVSEDEELARVIPVIRRLAREVRVPIAVDTAKPAVMRAAADAGAVMVNDVYALRRDGALKTAAELGLAVCLMHMQGEPRSMQENPHYDDVVAEVHAFLAARVRACEDAGIARSHIVVDPGFGFGKNRTHNLTVLRDLASLSDLAMAIYVGLSRKATIGAITGRTRPADRLGGSVAAALIAVQHGARMLRVHDVRPTVDALAVWHAAASAAGPSTS